MSRTLLRVVCVIALTVPVAWFAAGHTGLAAEQSNGWALVYERPGTGKYEDFAFPDSTHGWLVSAGGDILHTADGGTTWTQQASGMGALRSVDFLDGHRGFAGTIGGVLYGTIDGGVTWTDITRTLPRPTKGFCGITHVGEQVHIVGKYTGGAADYYFSPDGGKTWRDLNLLTLAQGLVDVMFINQSVGFIGGMAATGSTGQGPAAILKTTDGGRNWHTVFTHDGGRGFVWKLWPISATLIYAALQSQDGTHRIAKTTDGGDSWQVLTVATGQAARPGVQGIGFLDENTGWVGGFFEGMFMTTDGGRSWARVQMSDRLINRFEKLSGTLITAGSRGILRYDAVALKK